MENNYFYFINLEKIIYYTLNLNKDINEMEIENILNSDMEQFCILIVAWTRIFFFKRLLRVNDFMDLVSLR